MDKLKELFYTKFKGSLSLNRLWNEVQKNKIPLSQNDVKNFYNNQAINQIYKKTEKVPSYCFHCNLGIGCIQMDLMFMERFPPNKNKGFRHLCVAIDVYSRYCWVLGIETKEPDEILPLLKKIREEVRTVRKNNNMLFTSDAGTEFKGVISKYLKSEGIKRFIANPQDNTKSRTAIVERMNRTILDMLKKPMEIENTNVWADKIDKIIDIYNNQIHSSTNQTPYDVFYKDKLPNEIRIRKDFDYLPIVEPYDIGDKVRVLNKKENFDKKSLIPTYSRESYEIVGKDKNRYLLKEDGKDNKIRKKYLPTEIILSVGDKNVAPEKQQEAVQHKKTQTKKRRLNKEGLDVDEKTGKPVIPSRQQPARAKRSDRVDYTKFY